MKCIEAIVDTMELDQARKALSKAGVEGMTVLALRDLDRKRSDLHLGWADVAGLALKIAVVAPDDRVPAILEALEEFDSTVLVTRVVEAVRIRTGERGDQALRSRPEFSLCNSHDRQAT
jgi:nitrogen regulatory protein PII